jgi:hypothetical protein
MSATSRTHGSATHACPVMIDGGRQVVDKRRIFWLVFIGLSLLADLAVPLPWAMLATIPIVFLSWWVAYRSDWF